MRLLHERLRVAHDAREQPRERLDEFVRRGGRAAAPGRRGQPGVARGGVARGRGPAGVPGVHQAAVVQGHDVPDVLLSGHHARIARWRRDQALRRTPVRRPDLLEALDVARWDRHDLEVLAGCGWQVVDGRLRAQDGAGEQRAAGEQGAPEPHGARVRGRVATERPTAVGSVTGSGCGRLSPRCASAASLPQGKRP
ncbi:hypothetical protein ACFS33_19380 [Cellulomonas phragmiteti]|uniref:hypothetical protein n=1 Tax=Cellulomonas phragmiteti TaxID=478780 RepID=UPI00362D2595